MGFAAEIKEFVDSAQQSYKLMADTDYKDALTKYTATQREKMQKEMDDPLAEEQKRANLALTKARTGNIGAAERNQARLIALAEAQNKRVSEASSENLQPAGRPAIGAAPPPATADDPYAYARGGLVKNYANGGMVDDDEEDDVTPQVTMPAVGGMPPSGATDFSAQARPKSTVPIPIARSNAIQAINDGQKYGITAFGLNGAVPPASRQRGLKAYAMGAGAAPQDEMLNIYKKIDPNGEMGESERNMTAIGALYDYKMKQGDPQGAARVAFQALQSYKTAARNYAALGVAALQGGQVDAGLKAIMKSYANIPDGNDLKLYQGKNGMIGYEVTGPDGKKVAGGIAPPDQILGQAMKVAGGAGFDEHLAELATGGAPGSRGGAVGGRKKAATGDEGGADIPKQADYKQMQEDIGNRVNDFNAARVKAGQQPLDDKETAALKNSVYHIRRNNDVTDDEALQFASRYIAAPANEKEGKATMKVSRNKDGDMRTITFDDGRTLSLPESDYRGLAVARGEAIKQREEARNKPQAEGIGPKLGRAGEAAGEALKWGYDVAPPPGYETAKKAVGAIPEIASKILPNPNLPAPPPDQEVDPRYQQGPL
jgi:hypothetical protein